MTDSEAYVAFNMTDRVGSVKVDRLAAAAGSVAAAWEAYPSKVSRSGGEVDLCGEFARAKQLGVTIVTPADEAYPQPLRGIPGHPLALYVKGDPAALSARCVAVVGTRRASAYGADVAQCIAHDLAAAGWCIVSGLATGIDAAAHRGALDASGLTAGIIGSGLDRFYPEENLPLAREIASGRGAVVSEFPFGRPPDVHTFPQRNHVVAGLAAGVVVVETPLRGGTMITAGIAADLGRTVMAVPTRVDSRTGAGCLGLIRDGATLVRGADDVMEALGSLFPPKMPAKGSSKGGAKGTAAADCGAPPEFTLEEALVLRNIDEVGVRMDKLVETTGLAAAKVSSICMTLRLKGRVRFLPGNRVATVLRPGGA